MTHADLEAAFARTLAELAQARADATAAAHSIGQRVREGITRGDVPR